MHKTASTFILAFGILLENILIELTDWSLFCPIFRFFFDRKKPTTYFLGLQKNIRLKQDKPYCVTDFHVL